MKIIRKSISFIIVLALCCGLLAPAGNFARAAVELDEVFWNPLFGNDASDGETLGTAVLTFDRALELAANGAYLNLTAQYQVTSDATLDGGAGMNIRIRQYGLPGEGISIYPGCSLTLKNIAPRVDNPSASQMFFVNDNAKLIIGENVRFNGEAAVWLANNAYPIELLAPLDMGPMYINTIAPPTLVEGKVLVHTNGFLSEPVADRFILNVTNRTLQLETNGDLTVQRGAGSMMEVYVSTTVTGATPANDSNEGDDPARAVLTYAKAVSLLDDGGVIYVCNGSWNLDTAFGGGAIYIKDVTIKRSPAQATGYSFAVGTALFTWASATTKTVTVEDSFIDNNGGNAVFGAQSDLTIRRSEIIGCAGIVISNTASGYPIRIEASVIETTGPTAINYYNSFALDAENSRITGALFAYREAIPSIQIISDTVGYPITINYSTRTPSIARNLVQMESGVSIEPYASYFTVQVAAGYEAVASGESIFANPVGAVYVNEAEGDTVGRGNAPNAPVTLARALELVDEVPAVTDIFVMAAITVTTPLDINIGKPGVSILKYSSSSAVLFQIDAGGSLTLENVAISGANGAGTSGNGLVYVNGGELIIGSGAMLTGNGNYRTLVVSSGTAVMEGGSIIGSSTNTSNPAVWVQGGLFDMQSGVLDTSGGVAAAIRIVTTGRTKLYETSDITGVIFCSTSAGIIPLISGDPISRVFDVDFDGAMYGRTLVDGSSPGAYQANVGNYNIVDTDMHVELYQDGDDVSIEQETIVYLNGTAAGNDANDGLSPATAVRTFARAKAILQLEDKARVIYITGLVTVSGTEVWDLTEVPGAVVKRFGLLAGRMITVTGNLSLSNITIDGNSEEQPTATGVILWVSGASAELTMEDGAVVRNNREYYNVHVVSGATFTMNGGQVRDAQCSPYVATGTFYSGNVYVDNSTFTINTGEILNGDSKKSAGAGGVVVTGAAASFIMNDGLISGNSGYYAGSGYSSGGVYITAGAVFTMNGGVISDNGAAGGAGVFINTSGTFTMNDGEIKGNHGWVNPETGAVSASTGTGVRVGPRSGDGAATFNMYGGIIYDNVGAAGAGVGSVGTLAVFNMYGGTITGNTGTSSGGGVYNTGTFVMSGTSTISGNTSTATSSGTGGGGVHNTATGTFTLTNGTISGNTTSSDGGGVQSIGTFTMNNGEIVGNTCTAARGGGGLYISGGSAVINAGSISNNSVTTATTGYGGGVCIDAATATLTMNGGTISHNSSTAYGGGVSVLGTFVMNGGDISDNEANTALSGNVIGGGVFVRTGTFEMYDGEIKGNHVNIIATTSANTNGGGGVGVGNAANSVATFTMYGGLISDNDAAIGGGVRIRYNLAVFTMRGGEISDNTAVSTVAGTGRGGGVYLTEGTFNIIGGLITGNEQQDPPTTSATGITTDNTGEVDYTSGTVNISEGNCRITGNIFIRTLPGAGYGTSTQTAGSYLFIDGTITNAAQRYKIYLNQGTTATNLNQATGNGRIVVQPSGGLSSVALYLNNFVLANPVGSSFIAVSNSETLNTIIAIGPAAVRFIDGTAASSGDGHWPETAWNSLDDTELLEFIGEAVLGKTYIIFIVGQITVDDPQSIITPAGMNISFRRYSGFTYEGMHTSPAFGGDLFVVESGGELALENVVISGGDTDFTANGVTTPVTGSVVRIESGGVVELKSASIADAKSTADGVGIYQGGTLKLSGEPAVGCEVYLPAGKVIESTVAALGTYAAIEDIRLETPVDGDHVVVYPSAFLPAELAKYSLHSSQSDRYVLVQSGAYIDLKENVRILYYNANGATGLTVPATQRVLIEDDEAVADILAPTIPGTAGYKFLGWADSAAAIVPDFVYNAATIPVSFTPDSIDLLNPETTLYAVVEALVFDAELSQTTPYTFSAATYGYTAAPSALSVTLTNTGEVATGSLNVTLSGANAAAFTLGSATIPDTAVLGTRQFTVRPVTGLDAGTYTATVTVQNANIGPLSFGVSFTVTKATITAANILVTAPMKLEEPDTDAATTGVGFTLSSVSWSPSDDPFECSTAYTATVTLTAGSNYSFGLITQTINGYAATVDYADADTVTLSYTFASTAARAIAGLAVKTQPATLAYNYGDTLDLTGLVMTLTYDDASTEDVALSAFGTYSITASPVNGAALTIAGNDGLPVVISLGLFTVNTANLTVSKAAGAAVGTPTVSGTPTYYSITVGTVPAPATGQDVEYAISTISGAAPASLTWQSGTVFGGLAESTTYYVYARSVSNTNYDTGTPQISAAIATIAAPPVVISATGVTLDRNSLTMDVGDTDTLTATVTPANADDTSVIWSSSNVSAATVSGGVVTAVGAGTTTITVTTVDGGFTDSCVVTVNAVSAPTVPDPPVQPPPYESNPDPAVTPAQPPPPSAPSDDDAAVIVDGKEIDAGEVTVEDDTTILTIDQAVFNREIENAKDNVLILIPSGMETSAAQLVVKNVDDMADKGMMLTVMSGSVNYNIPAGAIDTKYIMETLGASDTNLVPVSISITAFAETPAYVQTIAGGLGVVLVLPPVEFYITAIYSGKTVEVAEFSQYVSRTVILTEEQAGEVTTAVVVESDGMVRHVPTYVYQENGNWYATISSLTNSVYALIYQDITFPDALGRWYEAAVNEMGSRCIVSGSGDSLFSGERSITRAEFTAIIIRALGLPENGDGSVFSDVSATAWYSGAIGKAYEYGLVAGIGGGRFEPDRPITRQEAMALIYNSAKLTGFTGYIGSIDVFSDAGNVSDWAQSAAKWNVGSGLILGSNDMLRPTDNISRAETVVVVLRLLQKSGLVDERSHI